MANGSILKWYCGMVIAITVLALLIGCQKDLEGSANVQRNGKAEVGGSDSGGGDTLKSSRLQVLGALKISKAILVDSDYRKNILMRFVMDDLQDGVAGIDVLRLFPNFPKREDQSVQYNEAELKIFLKSPVLDILRTRGIENLSEDFCEAADKGHAAASVTRKDLQGIICVSIAEFMKLPQDSLVREMTGLLIHELVHLSGGDENLALKWQHRFDDFYKRHFYGNKKIAIETYLIHELNSGNLLDIAEDLHKQDSTDPRIYSTLGSYFARLQSMPHFLDPLYLELTFQPEKPELVDNYSNSVLAILEKYQEYLGTYEIEDVNLTKPKSFKKDPKILLNVLIAGEKIISINFRKLLHLSGPGESTCLLPKGSSFRQLEFGSNYGLGANAGPLLPPKVCSPGTKLVTIESLEK